MKKRKIIFAVILTLFLCVGCDARYSVNINDDLSISETLSAMESNDFYQQYSNRMVGEIVASILSPYVDTLNSNNYYTDTVINPTEAGVKTSKEYSTIDEYINNTIFKSQYTSDDIEYSLDGNIITLSVSGGLSTDEQDQSAIPVTTARISINLPFKVIEQNADFTSQNTYYWSFDKDTKAPKQIKIVFDSSEMADGSSKSFVAKIKDRITDNRYLIFVVAGIVMLSISGCVVLYRKFREKQEKVNKI